MRWISPFAMPVWVGQFVWAKTVLIEVTQVYCFQKGKIIIMEGGNAKEEGD